MSALQQKEVEGVDFIHPPPITSLVMDIFNGTTRQWFLFHRRLMRAPMNTYSVNSRKISEPNNYVTKA